MATFTEVRNGGNFETDLRLELEVAAHELGASEPAKSAKPVDDGAGSIDAEEAWKGFESAAGRIAIALGALATTFTVVGATTDQVRVMTSAFPEAVMAMFMIALVSVVMVGVAWAIPNGTTFGSDQSAKAVEARRGAPRWLVRGAAAGVVACAFYVAWRSLRIEGVNFEEDLPVVFALVLGAIALLMFVPEHQTVSGAVLASGLAMFGMAVGGAIHLGVSASKFGSTMSAVPTVEVEGDTATVSVAVKAAQLPSGGGVRVYLVDQADPATVFGSVFVGASDARTVDTVVPVRVPATLATAEVRLVRCQHRPIDQLACPSPEGAESFAVVDVSTGAPTPALVASVAATDVADVYAVTVSGSGLGDIVKITVSGSEAVTATALPDEDGALVWTTSVRLARQGSINVKATSGATTATAGFRR